jgi:hypothetical protein
MTPGSRQRAASILLPLLLLPACAAQPAIAPGKPYEVRAHPLPPYQIHEECVQLLPGDRLEYAFDAQAPLSFNIHYSEGAVLVMPLSRERVTSDRGDFKPTLAREYCLMWEAGPQGTPVDYQVRLIRGKQ